MTTLQSGYDVLTPNPGEHESLDCPTCGTKMNVNRHIEGATGFAEAMSNKSHAHDQFICPHARQPWHAQAIRLLRESKDTASPSLRRVIINDLNSALSDAGAPKRHS